MFFVGTVRAPRDINDGPFHYARAIMHQETTFRLRSSPALEKDETSTDIVEPRCRGERQFHGHFRAQEEERALVIPILQNRKLQRAVGVLALLRIILAYPTETEDPCTIHQRVSSCVSGGLVVLVTVCLRHRFPRLYTMIPFLDDRHMTVCTLPKSVLRLMYDM